MQDTKKVALTVDNPFDELTLIFPEGVNNIAVFDYMYIEFSEKDACQTYMLHDNTTPFAIDPLIIMMQKALDYRLTKHASIELDIGYIWNENLARKRRVSSDISLVYEKGKEADFWVGEINLLWSSTSRTRPVTDTWLYNKSDGSIILEITPSYPWHFDKPKKNETGFITYREFMQQYKPIAIRTLSHETALIWLHQFRKIRKIIEFNSGCEYEL